MANPKHKTAHSKTRKRRSHLQHKAMVILNCPQCHEPKLAHRVCNSCGFYKGREIIKMEETKA